jgi:hypothetical protein
MIDRSKLQDLPQGGQAADAWAKPPRPKAVRRAHVLERLEADNKLWIATASADGSAHLVPFSFVWDGQHVTMATRSDSPAARNAERGGTARLALGDFSDVILIDGPLSVVDPQHVEGQVADRLARVSAIDGRRAPGFVYLQLRPRRIQTWWSGAELGSPTVMRNGQWLT